MHGLVDLYGVKAVEYLIAVAYLALFVPFWRYVQGGVAAVARAGVAPVARPSSWFEVPDGVRLHPGHAWVAASNGAVAVGLDDFAHHLVGPLDRVILPRPGTALRQGHPAFSVVANDREVPVLSPLDGTVVAQNARAGEQPGALHEDPYGAGWLLKVVPTQPSAFKQLLSGAAARAYVDACTSALVGRHRPGHAALAADGGVPVHGFARELDPAAWDALAREALLTDEADRGGV